MIARKYKWISMLCVAMLVVQILGLSLRQSNPIVSAASLEEVAKVQSLPEKPIVSFIGSKAHRTGPYHPSSQLKKDYKVLPDMKE